MHAYYVSIDAICYCGCFSFFVLTVCKRRSFPLKRLHNTCGSDHVTAADAVVEDYPLISDDSSVHSQNYSNGSGPHQRSTIPFSCIFVKSSAQIHSLFIGLIVFT